MWKNLDFNYRNGSANTLIYEYGTIFEGKTDKLDDIILCTTTLKEDDKLIKIAKDIDEAASNLMRMPNS